MKTFIGRTLGTVTILEPLGSGAGGMVFTGFQRNLRRRVAIKILPKRMNHTLSDPHSFRHEAELLASLSHPNIIPIFDIGEEDDCFYQVTQLAQGEDLDSILEKHQRHPVPQKRFLPLQTVFTIMDGLLSALAHAHENGVIHRDVKPANILMEKTTHRVLLADFGIAHQWGIDEDDCGKSHITGSPLYIAPERLIGEKWDARVDIFSAGVVLFKMAAGKLPVVENDPVSLLRLRIDPQKDVFMCKPSETSTRLDGDLEFIILKAIAYDPSHRYQNCREMLDDLHTYTKTLRI